MIVSVASPSALICGARQALLGALCGLSLYRRLTDRQFGTAVNLLLIASGAALLA